MSKSLRAVYENGVLRPLEPLDLPDKKQVTVVITEAQEDDESWLDVEFMRLSQGDADESLTLESVRQSLAKIPGSLTSDFVAERDDR
jgi:predicted DNA-binding antitoxin AbrB/MazE fold protein